MSRMSQLFVAKQLEVQRQNLCSVCRLAVKTLIERSSFGLIDDNSKELENCVNVLEHIFNHRLKPYSTWYGGQEPRCFWDYIRVACQRVPHNCLGCVEALEFPHTPLGKGRAWIRMCLMEKRLADYISFAIQQTKTTQNFYDEGSMMLSDDVHMLADLLLGLNCIDFSLDVKGVFLDYPATPAIDYTPFLKFDSRGELRRLVINIGLCNRKVDNDGSSYPPIAVVGSDDTKAVGEDQRGTELFKKLEEQFKITNDQKNYAEEMLRIREAQLAELNVQRQRLIENLDYLQIERKKDQTQLESVIVELQSQIARLSDENLLLAKKLQLQFQQRDPNVVIMSELLTSELRQQQTSKADGNSRLQSTPTKLPGHMVVEHSVQIHAMPSESDVVAPLPEDSRSILSDDAASTVTASLPMATEEPYGRDMDTASTAVLAGSFVSNSTNIPDAVSEAAMDVVHQP